MANNLKFEDRRQTISDILETKSLPSVVRVCEEENLMDENLVDSRYKVQGNIEVLLQKRLRLKYGHIKILNYYDNDVVQKEKGPEYVLEHDTYVGEEFLIPVKYYGKVKFVHRPGSWKRFTSVSQVIAALPRFIRLSEDTVALPSNGIGKNTVVSEGTTLEVIRKFRQTHETATFLECSDGSESFAFNEKDRINCTEVDDSKMYHLFELVRYKMLPKVIMFQNVASNDIILTDNELNSAMATGVEGPIELLGFADIELIIAWVREKEQKTFQTVLFPSSIWNVLRVQRRRFNAAEDETKYIKRKYPKCEDTGFVEKSLYMMPTNQCHVTWLRSPQFYIRTLSGLHMFEPIKTDFPDSSDDETAPERKLFIEMQEDAPPIPERHPHKNKDLQERNAKLKKSLFHKVHNELFGIFVNKEKDRPPSRKQLLSEGEAPAVPQRPQKRFTRRTQSVSAHDVRHQNNSTKITTSVNDLIRPINNMVYNVGPQSQEDAIYGHEYDYPDPELFSGLFQGAAKKRPLPKIPSSTNVDSSYLQCVIESSEGADKQQCLSTSPNEMKSSYGVSKLTEKKAQDVSLTRQQVEHLFRENQTGEDFYNYSVLEAFHCFNYCGMKEFAQICNEQKLDGNFFRNYDLNELKNEPFNLTNFQVLKVRQMIRNGWRPNYK